MKANAALTLAINAFRAQSADPATSYFRTRGKHQTSCVLRSFDRNREDRICRRP
jgi:hypothetical protein